VILIRILSAGFSGDFGQLWGQAEREMRSLLGRD
jgi:hypothetical protein